MSKKIEIAKELDLIKKEDPTLYKEIGNLVIYSKKLRELKKAN